METIEETHIDGGQREEEDEGKKNPGEFDREFQFSRDDSESGIEESDKGVGKDDPGSDDQRQDNQ